ncbi:MAG: 5-oxoprolinase subunit PxpB [Lutibacter sp.]|nr:5-oxoprolinase subunit PxpB [Lutibacter sp.]
MVNYQLTYKPFGESAILIEWPQIISKEILNDIRAFVAKIESENSENILELNFIYCSLLIIYNSKNSCFNEIKNTLISLYDNELIVQVESEKILWHIPVCYDEKFGIDLIYLSSEKKLSVEKIISLHCSIDYTVYGIGFLPGFLYLGGLSEKLYIPRRNSPRLSVPKGAVAIGGKQTGIYPQRSPGGWHIIGNTPILLFDVKKESPCTITPGDEIRFIAITKEEYEVIKIAQKQGNYELKRVIHG